MRGLLRRPPGRWQAARPPLSLIFSFVVCGTLSLHIFVPALPAAARDLAVSPGAIQLTLTVYVISLAAGQLVYGPLSDRFGRRPVLLAGLVLYTIGSLAAAIAPDLASLLAARVLQAAGGCAGLVLGRAVIRDTAPPREAAARLAWLNMFMSIAPALASIAGGALSAQLSWRAIFVLLGTAGLATLAAALIVLPETNRTLGQVSGGLLRTNLRLLALPEFRLYALSGAMATTSFYAFISAAPFIFIDQLGAPPGEIGFYFVVPMLGYSLGSLIANRLVMPLPLAGLLHAGFAVTSLGAALFLASVFLLPLSLAPLLLAMLVFTIGGGIVSPMALSGAIGVLPGAIGAAAGLYGCMQMAYGAICTLVVSAWHHDPATIAAIMLLGSALAAQLVFVLGRRAR